MCPERDGIGLQNQDRRRKGVTREEKKDVRRQSSHMNEIGERKKSLMQQIQPTASSKVNHSRLTIRIVFVWGWYFFFEAGWISTEKIIKIIKIQNIITALISYFLHSTVVDEVPSSTKAPVALSSLFLIFPPFIYTPPPLQTETKQEKHIN